MNTTTLSDDFETMEALAEAEAEAAYQEAMEARDAAGEPMITFAAFVAAAVANRKPAPPPVLAPFADDLPW